MGGRYRGLDNNGLKSELMDGYTCKFGDRASTGEHKSTGVYFELIKV